MIFRIRFDVGVSVPYARLYPHSPTPPASTALGGAGATRWRFRGCLIASLLLPVWENALLRTMRSAREPQFGVHLAADYGPKRSNSDRLAGSCLTISEVARGPIVSHRTWC